MFRQGLIGWLAAVAAVVLAAAAAHSAEVQFPFGSSIGLIPPPGLKLSNAPPGFQDKANKVSIVLLELPRAAYLQVEASMSAAAAKTHGIIIDRREAMFTNAGAALLSVGDDTRERVRKWMMAAQLSGLTAVVSVEVPQAARRLYSDVTIQAALESLTERRAPVAELLTLLPYKLDDLAGFRVVSVMNRSSVVLTDGPRDDILASDQPHMGIGFFAGATAQPNDRARMAHLAFGNLPGFVDRRITAAEMMRVDGQPAHEIRANARNAVTGKPVAIVQWLRFGRGSLVHVVGVTPKDDWNRDFPRFRAVRDGIQPKR